MREKIAGRVVAVILVCLMMASMLGTFTRIVRAADKFNIGDSVEVTTNLNVRTGPGTTYPEITDPDYPGYAPTGTIGKVLSGPSSADGYIWWEVDFGPGLYSGWSVEGGLKKVSQPPSPPTPTSPGSSSQPGPEIDDLTPTLQWSGVSGADYYALAISRYPYGSSNIIYNPQIVYGTSHTVPSGKLEYGQKYRWNMQAHNSAGWSSVSSTLYFQTYIAVQTPTVETRSATSITETAATLNGRVVSDGGSSIIERRFDWGTTSSCSDGWTASVSVSGSYFSYSLTSLNPGTTYYFRAWARNSAGWSQGSVLSFTTQSVQTPPPPTPTWPGSSSQPGPTISTLIPTLQWSGVSGADYYALAISKYPYGSTNIVYNPQYLYGTSHTVPSGKLEYGQKYRWNMQAHNSAGWSSVSSTLYFQTEAGLLPAPSLSYPSNYDTNVSTTPTFSWSAVTGASSYRILVGTSYSGLPTDPTASTGSGLVINATTTSTSYTPSSGVLSENTTYYWEVHARSTTKYGEWSSKWRFTTKEGVPSPPTPTWPGSSSQPGPEIDDLTPTLQWSGVSGADYYALAISKYPYGSTNIVYNPQYLYGTSHTVPSGKLEYGQKYRWNMQAHNSAGWSSVSSTLYFQTAIADVTLTLYVHEDSASGPVLSGVRVTGQDGAGYSFDKITNTSGYITITGAPDTWSFTASKSGYQTNSWSQSITTSTTTKHAYLIKEVEKPDLIIEGITWSPPSPSIGDTLTFTVTITNQGTGKAGSSKVYYFIDNAEHGYDYVDSIDAGATATETFTWKAQDGAHAIKAVADYKDEVAESDETNNDKTITFSATTLPDLIIESITWSPDTPSIGDTVTFAVTIKNRGNGKAGSSKVCYFIGDSQQGYDYVSSLDPGASATETFTWSAQEGTNTVKAIADCEEEVSESDETNNEKTVTLTPRVLARIDSYSPSAPIEVKLGDSVSLGVTFTNTGNTAWTFYAAMSLRRPDGTEEHLQPEPVPLTSGEQGSATWSYTIDAEGSWDVVFGIWKEQEQVNSLDHTSWLNDYVICVQDDISAPQVDSLSVKPNSITLGDSFTISYSVSDAGGSGLNRVELWRADDSNGSPTHWVEITRTSASGSSDSGSFTDTPSSAGFYWYGIHVADNAGNWNDEKNSHTGGSPGIYGPIKVVVIPPLTTPPVASFTISPVDSIRSGDIVHFDASSSYDVDGTIISYEWLFDDGETATGLHTTHRFRGVPDGLRTYHISLTVKDDRGVPATDTRDVLVEHLKKPVEVTHQPAMPIPGVTVFAKMEVSYNWIDERNGEDVYIVSRVDSSCDGFTGIYAFNFIDTHSRADRWATPTVHPLLLWNLLPSSVKEKSYGTESFKGFEFFEEKVYGKDFFEGIEVYASDMMFIAAYGWAGIHWEYAVPLFEWSSRDFQPKSADVPSVPMDINDLDLAHLASPGELRVYDSQGRVTGLVNGVLREEIPHSFSFNNTVAVLAPTDSYHYEVAGTEDGPYGLGLVSVEDGEATAFGRTNTPIVAGATHQYAVDWDALSQGEEGVTVQVDSDGDGAFEQTTIIQPPIASFILSPISALASEEIDFDASESRDVDGEIVSYKWNFGDGNASIGRLVTHVYSAPGKYTVTLAVVDNDGVISTYSKVVQVEQRQGVLPIWVWILIGVVIGCVIAFGVWRRMGKKQVAKR